MATTPEAVTRSAALKSFSTWAKTHITGDEKGEPMTAPGLPLDGKDRAGYITPDCIMPVTP